MSRQSKIIEVNIELPQFNLTGRWLPNEHETKAAWQLYIELITRITVEKLDCNEGSVIEAISSLHSLFGTTRKILHEHGPSLAEPQIDGLSFAYLAVAMLNKVLRPVLAEWHPKIMGLTDTQKQEKKSGFDDEIREAIDKIRPIMKQFSLVFAQASGVCPITFPDENQEVL